jgi:hypothetical protein
MQTPTRPVTRQILDHSPHHDELLVVLLPEVRPARRHELKQLEHNGCYALKVPWPRRTFERAGDGAHVDRRAEAGWIHCRRLRHEYPIATSLAEKFEISLQRPRILRKVLAGSKLRRIHKDACRDAVALGVGRVNEA